MYVLSRHAVDLWRHGPPCATHRGINWGNIEKLEISPTAPPRVLISNIEYCMARYGFELELL